MSSSRGLRKRVAFADLAVVHAYPSYCVEFDSKILIRTLPSMGWIRAVFARERVLLTNQMTVGLPMRGP